MKKETIKQIATIIFAVALLSAIIGFVGLIVLNFRFENSYYSTYVGYSSVFVGQMKDLFRECFLVIIICIAIAFALGIVIFCLSAKKYKTKKAETIAKILNICLSVAIIMLAIVSVVQVATLSGQISIDHLSDSSLQRSSYYDSFLSQVLTTAIPLIVAFLIVIAAFAVDLKKKKSKNQSIEYSNQDEVI